MGSRTVSDRKKHATKYERIRTGLIVDQVPAVWVPDGYSEPFVGDAMRTPYIRWLDRTCRALEEAAEEIPRNVPTTKALYHINLRKVDEVADSEPMVLYRHPTGGIPWTTSGETSSGEGSNLSFDATQNDAEDLSPGGHAAG